MAGGPARGSRGGSPPTTGTITSLSVRGRSGERLTVWLDGKRAFDISRIVADESGLSKGEWLDEDRVSELLRKDEPYRARDRALDLLTRRDLLGSELVSKLVAAGISQGEADMVLEWLQERGYVDDTRYAGAYVADKAKVGWGRRRIIAELARKGLDQAVAKAAWQDWSDEHPGDETGALVDIVKRRFGSRLNSDPEGTKRRVSAFLVRRGHDWDSISRVLKAVDADLDDVSDLH